MDSLFDLTPIELKNIKHIHIPEGLKLDNMAVSTIKMFNGLESISVPESNMTTVIEHLRGLDIQIKPEERPKGTVKTFISIIAPQPTKDSEYMWHWKDCQWMDGGIGMPASGIEDHASCKAGDILEVVNVKATKLEHTWVWLVEMKHVLREDEQHE